MMRRGHDVSSVGIWGDGHWGRIINHHSSLDWIFLYFIACQHETHRIHKIIVGSVITHPPIIRRWPTG